MMDQDIMVCLVMILDNMKTILLLILMFVSGILYSQTDTGWHPPMNCGGFYAEWINCAEAFSSDDVYASATGSYFDDWENFDHQIPDNAVIDGIEVTIEAKRGAYDSQMYPYMNLQWEIDLGTTDLTASDVVYTFGGATEKWGTIPLYTDFGAGFYIMIFSSAAIYVDAIAVKVYYTESSGIPVKNIFLGTMF